MGWNGRQARYTRSAFPDGWYGISGIRSFAFFFIETTLRNLCGFGELCAVPRCT